MQLCYGANCTTCLNVQLYLAFAEAPIVCQVQVQNAFFSGAVQVIVATIAFGKQTLQLFLPVLLRAVASLASAQVICALLHCS